MATVDLEIAKRVRAGEWPEDQAVMIVEYENAWGGVAYGVTFKHEGNKTRYMEESEYIRNPRVWWRIEDGYQK